MSYRLHRSHLRYATVAAPARSMRRPERDRRAPAMPLERPGPSGAMLGMIYGLPAGIALWLVTVLIIRALF